MVTLSDAAESGDRLAMLQAMRASLVDAIETGASARDLASLVKELRAVVAEIEQLAPVVEENSPVASIAARRAARLARAADHQAAGRRSQPRRRQGGD